MARKARVEGSAGRYRIRGAIMDLGSFAYRIYLHLIPSGRRPKLAGPVVSADGMTIQEVLGAAKEQVEITTGARVNALDVLDGKASARGRVEHSSIRRPVPRRYTAPTD
jgi:hypothetical protein